MFFKSYLSNFFNYRSYFTSIYSNYFSNNKFISLRFSKFRNSIYTTRKYLTNHTAPISLSSRFCNYNFTKNSDFTKIGDKVTFFNIYNNLKNYLSNYSRNYLIEKFNKQNLSSNFECFNGDLYNKKIESSFKRISSNIDNITIKNYLSKYFSGNLSSYFINENFSNKYSKNAYFGKNYVDYNSIYRGLIRDSIYKYTKMYNYEKLTHISKKRKSYYNSNNDKLNTIYNNANSYVGRLANLSNYYGNTSNQKGVFKNIIASKNYNHISNINNIFDIYSNSKFSYFSSYFKKEFSQLQKKFNVQNLGNSNRYYKLFEASSYNEFNVQKPKNYIINTPSDIFKSDSFYRYYNKNISRKISTSLIRKNHSYSVSNIEKNSESNKFEKNYDYYSNFYHSHKNDKNLNISNASTNNNLINNNLINDSSINNSSINNSFNNSTSYKNYHSITRQLDFDFIYKEIKNKIFDELLFRCGNYL